MKKLVRGKPELLKKINRNMIIKLIVKHKAMSRSQIASITELALPSVMRIVDSLIEEGLVIDIGKGESTGGRRPNLVSLNKDALYIFGVEIAENIKVVLSDLVGNIIDKKTINQSMNTTPTDLLELVYLSIEEMKNKYNLQDNKIAGIGIGTPGTNFKYTREVKRSILKGWETIDVKSWFEAKTTHMIEVENVARTRTLSELWFGKGRNIRSFIYVFVDRGVGCGIVNNGIIFKGANGVAGEFGHTTIDLNGRDCYCGKKGCIEMYVSTAAITNLACDVLDDKKTSFSQLISYSNNEMVDEIFENSGHILGVGIANLINTYNPEAVILGGEVSLSSELFCKAAISAVDKNIFSKEAIKTPVYISELDNNYACLGSVALVIDRVFESVEL